MAAPAFEQLDLAALHTDFADPELMTEAGVAVSGYLSDQQMVEDDEGNPAPIRENVLLLCTPVEYPVGTVIVRGTDRWEIVSVDDREGAFRHRLRKA